MEANGQRMQLMHFIFMHSTFLLRKKKKPIYLNGKDIIQTWSNYFRSTLWLYVHIYPGQHERGLILNVSECIYFYLWRYWYFRFLPGGQIYSFQNYTQILCYWFHGFPRPRIIKLQGWHIELNDVTTAANHCPPVNRHWLGPLNHWLGSSGVIIFVLF